MIDLTRLPASEAERLAYAEGFTMAAGLFARIADLEHKIECYICALEAISEAGQNGHMTARQCAGAASEALL